MAVTRHKPSKPAAVVGIFLGLGMLILGITTFDDSPSKAGLVFWCVGVVAITALNTWAAFSEQGATFVSRDDDSSPGGS